MVTYRLIKDETTGVILKNEEGNLVSVADFFEQFPSRIILFIGDLGSGKTTFIRHICQELSCKSIVNSPTFSIINEYILECGKVFHIDCYRLKDIEEAINSGVDECLHTSDYCFIEWPHLIMPLISQEATVVKFKILQDGQRILEVDNFIPNSAFNN